MKLVKITLITLFILPLCVYSQDTIFLNKAGDKVKNIQLADSYKITVVDTMDHKDAKIERVYYLSGKLKTEFHKSAYLDEKTNKKKFVNDGKFRMWYESGQLKREIDYQKDKFNGNLLTYWENGKIKRKDLYKEGKLIDGKCYTEEGYETDYYSFEVMPKFPGGERELLYFISRNIRYPVDAQENGIQGTTFIKFIINQNGEVKKPIVIRSLSPSTDQEACRIILSSPRWEPGLQDGEPVTVYYTLPIRYKME